MAVSVLTAGRRLMKQRKKYQRKKKNLITIASIFLKKQNQTINTAKRKTKVFLLKQLSPIKRSQAGNENNVLNVTEFCMTMQLFKSSADQRE